MTYSRSRTPCHVPHAAHMSGGSPRTSLWEGDDEPSSFLFRFRVTHIEKRYGLHEHRDGSPTDRSWGSSGGQDPGGGLGPGGGQPQVGTPAIESLPPERPQLLIPASSPVQNGGPRDGSLVPCAREGNPGGPAEPALGARGREPSPGPASQEASRQQNKLDTSDHQV